VPALPLLLLLEEEEELVLLTIGAKLSFRILGSGTSCFFVFSFFAGEYSTAAS
jgi:hypothetical protein